MQCPAKHWHNCTKAVPKAKNAARQAEKKLRETITPFLETAHEIAEKQCHDGHDYILETPLTCQVLRHPIVKQMTDDTATCVVNGKSWNNGKPAWWMTNRHVQTIMPRFFRPFHHTRYGLEQLDTPDGDFIELAWISEL